jgi:hypothetical protein
LFSAWRAHAASFSVAKEVAFALRRRSRFASVKGAKMKASRTSNHFGLLIRSSAVVLAISLGFAGDNESSAQFMTGGGFTGTKPVSSGSSGGSSGGSSSRSRRSGSGVGAGVGIGIGIGTVLMEGATRSEEKPPQTAPSSRRAAPPPAAKTAKDEEKERCPQYPKGDLDKVAPIETPGQAALDCGLLPGHVTGLAATSINDQRLIITRENNPASKEWYRDMNVEPKAEEFKKFHTGASGLVEGPDGFVLHNGKRMHADIDLFLVLKKSSAAATPSGYVRDIIDPRDNPQFVKTVNENLSARTEINKDWVQHGDQVSYVRDGFEQLRPKPFEKFVVTEPDGTIRVICGAVNLVRYLEIKKIPYPISDDGSVEAFLRNEELKKFYGIEHSVPTAAMPAATGQAMSPPASEDKEKK